MNRKPLVSSRLNIEKKKIKHFKLHHYKKEKIHNKDWNNTAD